MLALKLSRVSEPSDCMYDNIMLEGGGWPIGKQKLAAFLDPGFKGDLDPISLVGVRVWAETGINEHKGKQRLAVIIEGLKHGGYQRAEDPPPGKSVPEPVVESAPDDFVDGEDVPF